MPPDKLWNIHLHICGGVWSFELFDGFLKKLHFCIVCVYTRVCATTCAEVRGHLVEGSWFPPSNMEGKSNQVVRLSVKHFHH